MQNLKSNRLRYLLLLIVALPVIYLTYAIATAHPVGFCTMQQRFLSDDEFIEAAVRDRYRSGSMDIAGSAASIRAFRENNPKCCLIEREKTSLLGRMLGSESGIKVTLKYALNPKRIEKNKYYESFLSLTPCGEVTSSIGMSIESL